MKERQGDLLRESMSKVCLQRKESLQCHYCHDKRNEGKHLAATSPQYPSDTANELRTVDTVELEKQEMGTVQCREGWPSQRGCASGA